MAALSSRRVATGARKGKKRKENVRNYSVCVPPFPIGSERSMLLSAGNTENSSKYQ